MLPQIIIGSVLGLGGAGVKYSLLSSSWQRCGGWQRTEHSLWLLLLMLLKQYKYHNGHNYKANLDGSNIAILCMVLVLTHNTHVQCTN